jgi:hypothetical protein
LERFGLLVAALLSVGPAHAQSLSVEDIRSLVDQRVAGLDQYRALLNDPDAARASAAMEIMMAAEDPDLRRMALEFGLYSPAPVVRRTALDAFLATGPTLTVQVALPAGAPVPGAYRSDLSDYSGTISEAGIGFFPLSVGSRDDSQQCFLNADGGACLVRISDAGTAILLWNTWWQLALDDQGRLTGSGNSGRGVSATVTIPVTY